MNLTKKEIIDIAKKQLALDVSCNKDDFNKEANTIVVYKQCEGTRGISSNEYLIKIVSFGSGAIVSCDNKIRTWCKKFFKNHIGINCFEHHIMSKIDRELSKYNQRLNLVHELYLPYVDYEIDIKVNFEVKLFEQDEIKKLYKDNRFRNALIYDGSSTRPDVLALVAYEDGKIMGIAGAGKDCEKLWQIGVDVLPEHRKKGVAKTLVYLLTKEVLKRGAVPYYGTWCSNIASRNIAQSCGYFPAWVEMYSIDK